MGCSERGRELARTTALQELSDATAAAGETEGAGTQDAQDSHFICFVHAGGTLYELDGRIWDEAGVAFLALTESDASRAREAADAALAALRSSGADASGNSPDFALAAMLAAAAPLVLPLLHFHSLWLARAASRVRVQIQEISS